MDRITRVRIKNVRAFESVEIEVNRPFTILIGENGSGKSTIVECLELLRKAAEPGFLQQFYSLHRGMPGLLRKGATELGLGVVVEDDTGGLPRLEYGFLLASQGPGAVVQHESLRVGGKLVPVPADAAKPGQLLAGRAGHPAPEMATERLLAVLRGIEVHLAFDTRASWAARSYQRPESLRTATTHYPADRLGLLGFNLANAWSALRGREASHWEHTMALVRLGLGERVDSVVIMPDPGGGNVYLALRFVGLAEPVLAADLSDGQLSWLAFVAVARLNTGRSLLAVDEPELHMHPHLLGGVITLLKGVGAPVIVATHSDRVLELLDDPARDVQVCSLDEGGRATVAGLDPDELQKWLAHYGDLGQIRAAGYLSRVLRPAPAPAEEAI